MIQDSLVRALSQAVAAVASELGLDPSDLPTPELTRPRLREHGDFSTNVALVLAPRVGRGPREVAELVAGRVETDQLVRRVEVAGPGFINLFLDPGWLHRSLAQILDQGGAYGRAPRTGRRVQVEYVSANPTGPLHVGTARNAALGDSLANVLEAAGNEVEREYYFNDAGRQVELFAASVEARYLERFGRPAQVPEGGYHGSHVAALAEAIAADHGDSLLRLDPEERRRVIRREAVERCMAGIRATLERFRVRMDTWVSERTFHETGAIARVVEELIARGYAYRREGAVFFRSTMFGDEKDRVLIRSGGEPTYFAADCAYVVDKARRGFDRMIYVWGADHHGTVKRLLGAARALGIDPGRIQILIYQLVNLYRGGEPVRMSRRAGDYVTLDELLDEVGPDAARYTLLTRSPDSPLDFDIEAVTRQSLDNPVYYVQYAHARIASLLRVAAREGVTLRPWQEVPLQVLTHEAEADLIRKLAQLPEVIALAADTLAPHRLTRYAEETAAAFHRFYTECRVLGEDPDLTQARLWLSAATKQVLATTLALVGVSAPEAMERLEEGADRSEGPDRAEAVEPDRAEAVGGDGA
jgi:arginyl-tRNA synthetase